MLDAVVKQWYIFCKAAKAGIYVGYCSLGRGIGFVGYFLHYRYGTGGRSRRWKLSRLDVMAKWIP